MQALALRALPLLSIVAINTAQADSREAQKRFVEGDALLARGDFEAACAAFEASNQLDPRAGTLIRLGDCREQMQQLASALAAYNAALARAKDPAKRELAALKVRELSSKVSTLTIRVADISAVTVTRNLDVVPPTDWNRASPIDGGRYTIVATAPDHERFESTVTIAAASTNVVVDVTLPPLAVPTPAVVAQAVIEAEPPRRQPEPPRPLLRRPVFWLGVGGALIAGSLALYIAMQSGAAACTGNCADLR